MFAKHLTSGGVPEVLATSSIGQGSIFSAEKVMACEVIDRQLPLID